MKLRTLAHGISLVNRFAGQSGKGYSVAEHSVKLAKMVHRAGLTSDVSRAALLHDTPECLGISDIHSRIKRTLAPEIRRLEEKLMDGIWYRFGHSELPWHQYEAALHPIDQDLGNREHRAIFGGDQLKPSTSIAYWSPEEAEAAWLLHWIKFGGKQEDW